jgi:ribokinase
VTRVAVVGHVEWITFLRVARMPRNDQIVPASESWEEPGGSGAVAAVQLAKLAGEADFFTALAGDQPGRRTREALEAMGVHVFAAVRPGEQRRGYVHLDDEAHDRTITVVGERIVAHGDDDLPWERLEGADAVYVTGGDAGALRAARRAKRLVATPRVGDALLESGVRVDALVRSGTDVGEHFDPERLDPPPEVVILTGGREGGRWEGADGRSGAYAAATLPGPVGDAYGAGDSFAGGFTFGMADGRGVEGALEVAALAGAYKLAGRAAYGGQLTADDLGGT